MFLLLPILLIKKEGYIFVDFIVLGEMIMVHMHARKIWRGKDSVF